MKHQCREAYSWNIKVETINEGVVVEKYWILQDLDAGSMITNE